MPQAQAESITTPSFHRALYLRNSLKTPVASSGAGYCGTDAQRIPGNFVLATAAVGDESQ